MKAPHGDSTGHEAGHEVGNFHYEARDWMKPPRSNRWRDDLSGHR